MDFTTMALNMYPYWLMGLFMFIAIIFAGQKQILRIDPKAVFGWFKVLFVITFWRFLLFKIFPSAHALNHAKTSISLIPIGAVFFVPWEDLCHTVPLYLVQKVIGTKWFTWPIHVALTVATMIAFGIGHIYQGIPSACLLSLYIPITLKYGKKFGFGTVMLCHFLFDFCTILSFRYLFGA